MTLKQVLTFDINRVLRWDVGRALNSDIMKWEVPSVLLRAVAGFIVAGLLLAIIVPFAVRRGWHLNEWVPSGADVSDITMTQRSDGPRSRRMIKARLRGSAN